jgi:hypothetical protein
MEPASLRPVRSSTKYSAAISSCIGPSILLFVSNRNDIFPISAVLLVRIDATHPGSAASPQPDLMHRGRLNAGQRMM